MRIDGRQNTHKRQIKFLRNYLKHAEGSVLVEFGDTKVICSATIEDRVPQWLKGQGQGWVTAEYALLPRSTKMRVQREASKGKITGRTHEIQRLIGRSLRSIMNLNIFGEKTVWIDCDVIQADGGTRTAAITGAYIALVDAMNNLYKNSDKSFFPIIDFLAAISVGIVNGELYVDLCYEEDSKAVVDMNLIMTGKGDFVEVQGTGENGTFTYNQLQEMLQVGAKAISEIIEIQKKVLGEAAWQVGACF